MDLFFFLVPLVVVGGAYLLPGLAEGALETSSPRVLKRSAQSACCRSW